MASSASKSGLGQCFIGYEESDLLWQGRKIAGAAQRRRRDGLLIQGSVQPPVPILRGNWQGAACEAARSLFGVNWVEFRPDDTLGERASNLVRLKYSQAEYNRKR